jgi:8-hydroxy-5-deazaflavin:NADPH oxidoreductase
MDVTIIGTGNMARGIGSRLLQGGNRVKVLGKDEQAAAAVAEDLRSAAGDGEVQTGRFGDPIDDEVVVLAVYYPDAIRAVEDLGDQLEGKVVVDITNPVNESYDALVVAPDGSAARDIAERAPGGARVVKAFNTTFANTLREDRPLDVFLAGDDEDAKQKVAQLAEGGGLRAIDTGGLDRARELEALGLLHMSVQGPLGSGFTSAVRVET